ncbi:MAG: hypothetical protein ACE5IO_08665 [Thermoplasmata archaeon]
MDWLLFSLGILAGIIIGVVSSIIAYECRSRRERSLEERSARKQWNVDLGWELVNFCEEWNEFKGCITPGIKLRRELIALAREIRQRSLQELVGSAHQKAIGKSIRAFLKQAKKLPNADDRTWSDNVMENMDEICSGLRRISSNLRK